MIVALEVEPYYIVTMILCSCVFCDRCQAELAYTSTHPQYCDENYYDQAVAMKQQEWTVTADLKAYCPTCARFHGV